MNITDEMVDAYSKAAFAVRMGTSFEETVRAGLAAVAPMIAVAYGRDLVEVAWDGRARGAILGAIEQLEEAEEPPPLCYRTRTIASHRAEE